MVSIYSIQTLNSEQWTATTTTTRTTATKTGAAEVVLCIVDWIQCAVCTVDCAQLNAQATQCKPKPTNLPIPNWLCISAPHSSS